MKTKIILGIAFLGLFSQILSAQKVDDWFNVDALLDIYHIKTSPQASREEIVSFLNDEYFPVVENAYPGTVQFHVEGIAGDRKGQHAKFWIFPTVAVRNSYYPELGKTSAKYVKYRKAVDKKVSQNKMVDLFRGWDYDFNTDWRIIGMTEGRKNWDGIKGLEFDVHYVSMDYKGNHVMVKKQLKETLKNKVYPDSQFFILYGERDIRKGGYAILELHTPGQSQKSVIENLELPLEKDLFSSYRIW